MAGVHVHSRIVRPIPSDDVHLTHKHHTAYRHGNRDDGQIHARKVATLDMDVFPRHAVDRGPELAVYDGDPDEVVDFLPCLKDVQEEDGRADICSGELRIVGWQGRWSDGINATYVAKDYR
jgi:hypothetical protein